jgi:hypothetical protein
LHVVVVAAAVAVTDVDFEFSVVTPQTYGFLLMSSKLWRVVS